MHKLVHKHKSKDCCCCCSTTCEDFIEFYQRILDDGGVCEAFECLLAFFQNNNNVLNCLIEWFEHRVLLDGGEVEALSCQKNNNK